MGSMYDKVLVSATRRKKRKNQRDGIEKKTQQDLIVFEGGRMWPQAKECGWLLESEISNKIYSLLEPL